MNQKGLVLSEIGTGKTQSALWAADYLMEQGLVNKALIISPLSTLERVWGDSVFTSFTNRQSVTLHGTAERRRKLLNSDADFYVVNHDGFEIIAADAKDKFELMIIDEAAVLRNPSTDRFKVIRRFIDAHPNMRVWLMTGTPTPNEPTDAWALAKLINSPTLTTTYTGFRDRVMLKTGQWRWLPRPNSPNIVADILQPSIRYSRDDCLDLPDTVFQTRQVALTAEQDKFYKKMVKDLIVEAQRGDITAANEAIKMQKLVQIALGCAYDTNGNGIEIDCAPRLSLTKDLIDECGGKVIVFVPYTGALHMVAGFLAKHFSVAVVNGEVTATKRNKIFSDFQDTTHPRILVAHPATMAHGLTLTAASSILWYGPITSNEQYVQANGRIERIGKKHTSNVIHIESTALERKVFERLQNKQRLQGTLLEILQGE